MHDDLMLDRDVIMLLTVNMMTEDVMMEKVSIMRIFFLMFL